MGDHLIHVLLIGAKHDIFTRLVRDMPCKYLIQSICFFQCPAECIQILLVHILNSGRAQIINSVLISCQLFLILINGRYIFRGRQNSPDDGFAQGHFRCNVAVKQFLCHITVVIKVADIGSTQTQYFRVRAELQQFQCACTPALGTHTVKFIQDDIGRIQPCNSF